MRRPIILSSFVIACLIGLPAKPAHAQISTGPASHTPSAQEQADDDAAKKKKDEEWNLNSNLALPGKQNSGPCPYVKVLYDAGRYIEFKDSKVAAASVAYTGEFEGLTSACEYTGIQPIHVMIQLLFGLGRGPQAIGQVQDLPLLDRRHRPQPGGPGQAVFRREGRFPAGEGSDHGHRPHRR